MVAQLITRHAVDAALDELEATLNSLDPSEWASLGPAHVVAATQRAMRIKARLESHLIVAARRTEATRVDRAPTRVDTGQLLGEAIGRDPGEGRGLVKAAAVIAPASAIETAMTSGTITPKQAKVIGSAVTNLPAHATEEQKQQAETMLLRDAQRLSLKDLRRRADRAADTFAPPVEVDAHENALLEARERRARERTAFSMWDNGDGTHSGRFTLPDLEAAFLRSAVQAYSAPRRVGENGMTLPTDRREGEGFFELVSHIDTDGLPNHGGVSAQVMVTMTLEQLTCDLEAAAELSDGTRISGGEARRLACNAGLVPVVLGGESTPLDLGASRRLFTPAQRKALALRDGGCTYPGCDRPPSWCEANHVIEWEDGGPTDLDNAALLCSFHHHLIHRDHIITRINHDTGRPEYHLDGHWRSHRRYRAPRPTAGRLRT